jgi:3-hydroxyanthranilate 3,4-dioxygenase
MTMPPFNLQKWIEEHRHLLKPPVGNCLVFPNGDFIIMAVGGPNIRKDYHIDPGPEFFYQIQGTINLRILENGKPKDLAIHEGDVFLLPSYVPHSPQRPANTVGLVIERKRIDNELDGFLWICDKCNEKLYQEDIHVSDIVNQLPKVFEHFYGNVELTTCKKCATVAKR